MRIVHLSAGAAGMYCGACARDVLLARGLIARGHDFQILPLYTPLKHDGSALPEGPLFYGGVLCYLEQMSSVFARLPRWMERLLSSRAMLRAVSRFAVSTRPADLGPLTVSVLAGADGRQAHELAKLIAYLKEGPRPNVVSLTASLLSGVAPEVRAKLGVPVVCSLQGEEDFIESLPEPHRGEARRLLRKNAAAVDVYLAPGETYAARMRAYLDVPPEKVRYAPAGVDAESYAARAPRSQTPFTVGYLSVITPRKGLDLAIDAVLRLWEQGRDVRLRVAGRVLHRPYWRTLERRVAAAGKPGWFEYCGEVDFTGKVNFLRRCNVFVLPSRFEESRGQAVMEAMASGAPVVAPNTGIFPELLARTQGGALFRSGDANALADEVARMMEAPERAEAMGRAAAEGVRRHYSAEGMVDRVLEVYTEVTAARRGAPPA